MSDRRDEPHDTFSNFRSWMREEEGVEVPVKFAVCETCEGKGTHVNPSIDSHGIGADEWAEWDEEDRERYMRGGYDVRCYECDGQRVVEVLDEDRAGPKLTQAWHDWLKSSWESWRESEAERRMGA